jgi:hypothetical protein
VEISKNITNPVQFNHLEWNKFLIPFLLGSLHTVQYESRKVAPD